MQDQATDVWVTGIGLVSSLGDGKTAHVEKLASEAVRPVLNETTYSPYTVHPLAEVDLGRQIAKKSDQRQMEPWQRIGVYAAGQALEDAGVKGDAGLLGKTNLVVAAGSGERDTAVDAKILATIGTSDTALLAKEVLPTALRPTLFLAQLSNLLAGNISIVHNVTGSSRTFMGEEMAGMSAIENAVRRIGAGQGELFLVGGALNAEREDLLLEYELGRNLWSKPFRGVWERREDGGGYVPGSMGAFLVLEARSHAEARGRKPYARIAGVGSDRSRRNPGDVTKTLDSLARDVAPAGTFAVLSGACGVETATSEEQAWLSKLSADGRASGVRAYGSLLGHGVEAHFPAGIALAALAIDGGKFYPPFGGPDLERPAAGPCERVLVTAVGHGHGEALALLDQAI